jgi:hypothetical protein
MTPCLTNRNGTGQSTLLLRSYAACHGAWGATDP